MRTRPLSPDRSRNEAFLRLIDLRRIQWHDRARFLALSARLMRRILVHHARSRKYQKRGSGVDTVALDNMAVASPERGADLVALDDALDWRLANVWLLRGSAGRG